MLEAKKGDFDLAADPFNQRPKDNKGLLNKRLDAARLDGRLNIAALSLTEIPDEVLRMYDADAMAASNIAWNEAVDLVRLNAADNELTTVSDNAFPDKEVNLEEDETEQASPFRGLEYLDFHGNALQTVPLGFRRLERLTTLNLVSLCYHPVTMTHG